MKPISSVLSLVSIFSLLGCSSPPSSKSAVPAAPEGSASSARPERNFHFEYVATVGGLPAGAKGIRIWVPLPSSNEAQTITNLKVASPVPYRETRDALYGNRMAYFEAPEAPPAGIPIAVSFDVHRLEVSSAKALSEGRVRARALERDQLVPLDGEVAVRAKEATAGKETVPAKARGIYDRVLKDVTYDKTGEGWGRGDVQYVCQAGKGNCSDFHALFIGMARNRGIPSLFEIGFPLPLAQTEGTIGGYHCWAWYEEQGGLWRPVDASEADKDPTRQEYFFGTLCCNRVAFSRGRDLVLDPPQAGAPLNFFIYPYVEVDGKAVATGVEKKFSFRDLGK